MVAASRAKTSDRAAILKKLLPAIKKQYKVTAPKHDRPVLETMLFAICLEDASVEEAEKSYTRLLVESQRSPPEGSTTRNSAVNPSSSRRARWISVQSHPWSAA